MTNIWQIHRFPTRGSRKVWCWASLWPTFTIVLSASNATHWQWNLVINTNTIILLGRISLHYNVPIPGYKVTLLLLCYVVCTWEFLLYNLLMAVYTLTKLANIHLLYGVERSNSWEVRCLYMEWFPWRRLPNHVTFRNLDDPLHEIGFLAPPQWGTGRPRSMQTV